jgi:hypothetical protein
MSIGEEPQTSKTGLPYSLALRNKRMGLNPNPKWGKHKDADPALRGQRYRLYPKRRVRVTTILLWTKRWRRHTYCLKFAAYCLLPTVLMRPSARASTIQ